MERSESPPNGLPFCCAAYHGWRPWRSAWAPSATVCGVCSSRLLGGRGGSGVHARRQASDEATRSLD